jgi:hypothetical protein
MEAYMRHCRSDEPIVLASFALVIGTIAVWAQLLATL